MYDKTHVGQDLELKYIPLSNSTKEAFACKYILYSSVYMFTLNMNLSGIIKANISFNNLNAKHHYIQTDTTFPYNCKNSAIKIVLGNNGNQSFYKLSLCLFMKYTF